MSITFVWGVHSWALWWRDVALAHLSVVLFELVREQVVVWPSRGWGLMWRKEELSLLYAAKGKVLFSTPLDSLTLPYPGCLSLRPRRAILLYGKRSLFRLRFSSRDDRIRQDLYSGCSLEQRVGKWHDIQFESRRALFAMESWCNAARVTRSVSGWLNVEGGVMESVNCNVWVLFAVLLARREKWSYFCLRPLQCDWEMQSIPLYFQIISTLHALKVIIKTHVTHVIKAWFYLI